ncbi:MAG: nicotinamide riboside transporter PnuC, partial [Pasteurellaceae bacterium]|nr:nicotinamide riboside transporter PnuC [Pasteurellaceae bacterium]
MIVFFVQPDLPLAAIAEILCVVFVGKGKISNYFFGLISVSLYAYISYTFQLYGEMMLNLFSTFLCNLSGFIFGVK